MNRSSRAQPMLVLAALMALVVGLAVMVALPATARAQANIGASMTLHVSPTTGDQPFRTVAVSLDPGQTGIAAVGAALIYDTDAVVVGSCAISEVGACNVTDDGKVLVSVFNLTGLKANEQLLTINFEPAPGASGQASFELVITTAVTATGERLADIIGDVIEVDVAAASSAAGSLTGTVVAADSATGLFAIDVCITHDLTGINTCTTSSGLGNWRIDDIAVGTYSVTAADATDVYATQAGTGHVVQGQIASVDELAMSYNVDEAEPVIDEKVTPPAEVTAEPTPRIVADTTIVVIYEASITGRITGLRTEAAIEAAQVCATQPFVLHQSCATTDADGQFSLAGLSTGNYWVEVVDPTGRFEQFRPTLVGVVSDETARSGVNITMRAIAE